MCVATQSGQRWVEVHSILNDKKKSNLNTHVHLILLNAGFFCIIGSHIVELY